MRAHFICHGGVGKGIIHDAVTGGVRPAPQEPRERGRRRGRRGGLGLVLENAERVTPTALLRAVPGAGERARVGSSVDRVGGVTGAPALQGGGFKFEYGVRQARGKQWCVS